jgi:hypothetical protein
MPLILPNTIANGQAADGDKLDQNFRSIESFVNTDVILRDGSVAMSNPLLLPGPPTTTDQAATKGYADTKVAKTGDTMTGALTATTLTTTGVANCNFNAGVTTGGNVVVGQTPDANSAGTAMTTTGAFTASVKVDNGRNLNLYKVLSPATDIGQIFAMFFRNAAAVGSISIATGSTVAYNTSSDPRLKQRSGDVADAAALVQRLGGAAFRGHWLDATTGELDGGGEWVMLSSHDVEDVAPYAVTGVRNAVDSDGAVVAQQVNFPALVPLLAAALAQALDRIDVLEHKA